MVERDQQAAGRPVSLRRRRDCRRERERDRR
jgi:hypothetical protein